MLIFISVFYIRQGEKKEYSKFVMTYNFSTSVVTAQVEFTAENHDNPMTK